MRRLNELVNELRRHKTKFLPEDTNEDYLQFVFRYTDNYLNLRKIDKSRIEEFMEEYVSHDLEYAKHCYHNLALPLHVYVPDRKSIPKIVQVDFEWELRNGGAFNTHFGHLI